MAGRTGPTVDGRYEGVMYLESTPANGYVPAVPTAPADLVYLCFPNNPTGAVATRAQLAAWVDYARRNKAVLLYDSAYEAYIRDPAIPHSIYEIEGAREVAIEFRSFSKTAGFTGTRCAYTVSRSRSSPGTGPARPIRCTRCGTAGTRPSSTGSPTRSRGRRRRSSPRRVGRRPGR